MRDYYLLIDGQQAGPYTAEYLHELLAQGKLTSESPAWYDGLPDWVQLRTILEDVALPVPAQLAPAPTASSQVAASLESQAPVVISISKTGLRKGAYAVGLLLILFFIYYFASPFYALHALKSAVAAGDGDALETHVDFPALRESLKQEIKAEIMDGMSSTHTRTVTDARIGSVTISHQETSEDTDPFSLMIQTMTPSMIDDEIDGAVTPSGSLKYLSVIGKGGIYPANPIQAPIDLPIEHAGFDSLTDFRFVCLGNRFYMHFYGTGWKIYRIKLPSPELTKTQFDQLQKEIPEQSGTPVNPADPAKTDTSSSQDTNAVPFVAPEPPKPSHPALDAKMGFRTYKLGTPFSQFNPDDLDAQETFGKTDMKPYDVKTFDKQLGAAEIDSIRLIFVQDILQDIIVQVSGKQSSLALKDALIAAYGQPDVTSNEMSESDTWFGDDCVLTFSQAVVSGTSSAEFNSKSVDAKIKAITEEKAKAGAAAGAQNL